MIKSLRRETLCADLFLLCESGTGNEVHYLLQILSIVKVRYARTENISSSFPGP